MNLALQGSHALLFIVYVQEAMKKLCNWKYINCIDLWVMFISLSANQDVANHKFKAIQIDLEDLFHYKDLDEDFLGRITENTWRYIGIFADAIDELMPEPTEAFPDDDQDILMTQRSEEGTENTDGSDPLQRMPPEIKRF
ncbi:Mcm2-7 hexameric complex component [Sarracenia purpurea var. burkii]